MRPSRKIGGSDRDTLIKLARAAADISLALQVVAVRITPCRHCAAPRRPMQPRQPRLRRVS
jgi:hypothetical protein